MLQKKCKKRIWTAPAAKGLRIYWTKTYPEQIPADSIVCTKLPQARTIRKPGCMNDILLGNAPDGVICLFSKKIEMLT